MEYSAHGPIGQNVHSPVELEAILGAEHTPLQNMEEKHVKVTIHILTSICVSQVFNGANT